MSPGARLQPPKAVLAITRELETSGFQAWCVGGAVRDALMGHAHLDWDLATNATPDQVRTIFGRRRTVPVGVEFGTVGVLDSDGVMHDITTFRRDVRTDGRHAEVEFGASLDEDLSRRDFTVNAIAYSPSALTLHDPFDGQGDIQRRLIKAVGDPVERMREDRLRALRAIRFAARFGFEIEAATMQAIRDSAPHLTWLSAERVKQELEKTMDQLKTPSVAIRLWRDTGALGVLVPELEQLSDDAIAALDCAAQPGLSRRPGRRILRMALLFSDLTGTSVSRVATRLRFSKQDVQWMSGLVERWRRLVQEMSSTAHPGAVQVRRWVAAIGRTYLSSFFRLASALWDARRQLGSTAPAARAVHSLYRRALRAAMKEPVDLRDLAVDGEDLQGAGVPAGPGLGKILGRLLEWVLEDPS